MRYLTAADSLESGIQWLGRVPSTWAVQDSRRVFAPRLERARTEDRQLTASQKHGMIYQDQYILETGHKVVLALGSQAAFKHVEPGDFVLSLRSFQGGLELCRYAGKISPAYNIVFPKIDVDSGFFAFCFKSDAYIQELRSTSNQLRDGQSLSFQNFSQVPLPLPPLSEQRAIASFLDRETAQIDELIAKQNALIELLAERRKAVITRAVTMGLDPDVPMKHSGVEWLGYVPSDWRVLPLRYALRYQEGPGIMAIEFLDEGVPLLRISSLRGSTVTLDGCNFLDPAKVAKVWSHFQVSLGDLLISASASTGSVSEVREATVGSIPYTGLIRMIPGAMTKEMIRWFVVSRVFLDQVDALKTGTTIQHFGPAHLRQMRCALPPPAEQRRIVRFLAREVHKLDQLSQKAGQVIALLQERRSALITAAVTGKIDVRGEV